MTIGYPTRKNDITPHMPYEILLAIDTYQTSLTHFSIYAELIRSYYQSCND